MHASTSKTVYTLSEDCFLDGKDHLWQACDITKTPSGYLSLYLDTNPIENRIYCDYYAGRWHFMDHRGADIEVTSIHHLVYLERVRKCILE